MNACLSLTMEDAFARLGEGGMLVFPTETFYALGCLPQDARTLERLFAVKGRPPDRPLPLLAGDFWRVLESFALSPAEEALCRRFWPGPLTVLLTPRIAFPDLIRNRRGRVAVRVSPHPVAAALASGCGLLTATSANISGRPPASRPEDLDEELLARLGEGDGVLPDLPHPEGGLPSTIVELPEGEGGLRILRQGAIPASMLAIGG
ncbi:MAG: Sua5/YciO/YrdC/YwlC family protein [Desulfovibrio sp.]|jgi:L-threonylcarbamoyladenylate synthase|nr:Sua5/YciO/YrdC/YwlC family protein [Desulfovibrio sp.]